MAVATVGVVGDHHVWAHPAMMSTSAPTASRRSASHEPLPAARLRADHPGIPPAAGAAEIDRARRPERLQRRGQLRDAVTAELVGVVDGQLCLLIADDLALLAEGAGDDPDVCAPRAT